MINIIAMFALYTCLGLFIGQWLFSKNTSALWSIKVGECFFIGIFTVVIINNLIQLFDIELSSELLFNGVVIIASLYIVYDCYRSKWPVQFIQEIQKHYSDFRINWYLLAALLIILLHLYYISIQNQSLPLTPWDAWNGWIAKAKIWYFHGLNETLVNRPNWLVTEGNFTNPTAHYPDALPLLYVFNSGFYGWNETALNAIYPAMFVAFLLAFYGHVKLLTNQSYALVAVLTLVMIPFVNIHVSLAGYADIWVAALLALILFNAQHFLTQPDKRTFIRLLVFLVTLVMFKLESWVWLAIFIVVFMLCLLEQKKRKWVYLFLSIITIIWYLFDGVDMNSPFGQIIISPDQIKIPALGSYKLAFVNTTSAWMEALFYSKNWNLLWFTLPFALYFYTSIKDKSVVALPALFLMFTLSFLYVLFYMTYASIFANDFTSSNRIVLHIVPVYLYFVIQLVYQNHSQHHLKSD